MTKDCLDSKIISIQCNFVKLSAQLATALSINSKKIICLNRKNVTTSYLLNILRCYKPFISDVTYAYKVVFTINTPGNVNANLTLKDNVYNLNDNITTNEELAIYYEQKIKTQGGSIDYEIERIGNILYLYSYDIAASFNDVTLFTVITGDASSSIVSLQNNLSEILDSWNTITEKDLCKLLTFASKEAKYTTTTINNSTCNC